MKGFRKILTRGAPERFLMLLFWVLLMLSFNSLPLTVLTLTSALVHECAHAAVLYRYRGRGRFVSTPRGMILLRGGRTLSYREELMLTLSGPLSNVMLAVLCVFLYPLGAEFFSLFSLLNLLTALSNLIPVQSYDGHKILFLSLCLYLSEDTAYRICRWISLLFTSALTFLSLYLIGRVGGGYWIFGVFFVSLTAQLFGTLDFKKKTSI